MDKVVAGREKNWPAVGSPFTGRDRRDPSASGTRPANSSVEPSTGILVPEVFMVSLSPQWHSIQICRFTRSASQEGE